MELDVAEEFIRDHGAEPGFLGYGGFPNSICTSRNEAVVHGLNDKPLENGDIVSIDCGVLLDEFYGDSPHVWSWWSYCRSKKLLEVTKACLDLAVQQTVSEKNWWYWICCSTSRWKKWIRCGQRA